MFRRATYIHHTQRRQGSPALTEGGGPLVTEDRTDNLTRCYPGGLVVGE
jgi:hypothetical protein